MMFLSILYIIMDAKSCIVPVEIAMRNVFLGCETSESRQLLVWGVWVGEYYCMTNDLSFLAMYRKRDD